MKFIKIFCFVLLFSGIFMEIPLESAPQKRIHSIRYSGRRWVNLNDVAAYYGMKLYVKGNNIYLYSRYSMAVFNVKKRAGSFNGIGIYWYFTPVKYKNVYYLSLQDFLYTLDPLLRPRSLKGKPVRTVMIDAGHGGKDTGAIGTNKAREKDITLAIALKLRRKLIRLGYAVRLTRARDTFPSLEQRVTLWKNARPKPDLFISIHCNAAGNKKVSGVETFAATPLNVPSTNDTKLNTSASPGNAFSRNNNLLAYYVQRSLSKTLPKVTDRGVKHARFYVIRNVACPAILIETGFLSNNAECKKLSSDAYQEQVANSILRGILNYSAQVR